MRQQARFIAAEIDTIAPERKSGEISIKAADLKKVAEEFNLMSDFITVNGHMWAVEDRSVFKGHPHYQDLFQLCFTAWEKDVDYDTTCPVEE